MKTRLIFYSLLLIFLAFIAVIVFSPSKDTREIQSEIERSIFEGYQVGRFNEISVELSNCTIFLELVDTDGCAGGSSFAAFDRLIDLRKFETSPRRIGGLNPSYPQEVKLFHFAAGESFYQEHEDLRTEYDRHLTKARAQLGRGTESAAMATRSFLLSHDLESLPEYTLFRSCDGSTHLSFSQSAVRFFTENQNKTLKAIQKFAKQCVEDN